MTLCGGLHSWDGGARRAPLVRCCCNDEVTLDSGKTGNRDTRCMWTVLCCGAAGVGRGVFSSEAGEMPAPCQVGAGVEGSQTGFGLGG